MTPDEIKALRKARGWSQQQMADKLDVHRMTVSRWERGEKSPDRRSLRALERLSRASKRPPSK